MAPPDSPGPAEIDVVAAFHAELARSSATADAGELLPDRIARACVAVLPVDAAGLSATLLPGRRLPLGSSDPMAALAERLQFALGDGPCTAAHREHGLVMAIGEEVAARWPVYAMQLEAHTPYWMAVSLPVGGPLANVVVLDLYRHRPGRPSPTVLQAVTDIAGACGRVLADDLAEDEDVVLGLPTTLRGPAIEARQQVWRAIGLVASQLRVVSADALATLRALAMRLDMDLETVADRVLRGEVEIPGPLTG